jgi:hypothetical protein
MKCAEAALPTPSVTAGFMTAVFRKLPVKMNVLGIESLMASKETKASFAAA